MPLDNFKEIVDKKGYRVERDDRELFESSIGKSNIGRGFSDYIEFILYDSDDNQLPQNIEGESDDVMVRYIPLTEEATENYLLLEDRLNKKINNATQYIIDTEKLIKEAGYGNGVFKTHTAIINRRVGSERPSNEKAELTFEDSLWIQEISPSRTEIRVLPMRDANDNILSDLDLRYNIFLNEGQFYDDTIYYVMKFVQSLDLETIIGSFLTLKGSKEKGQKFRDLIKKEFGIQNWDLFLSKIRDQWIESVRFFVQNKEWKLSKGNYGESLSTIPSPDLSIDKIQQIVQTALIEAIEKFLPKRDIQTESILTKEEQESHDKIRQILKRLTSNKNYTNNKSSAKSDDTTDKTDNKEKDTGSQGGGTTTPSGGSDNDGVINNPSSNPTPYSGPVREVYHMGKKRRVMPIGYVPTSPTYNTPRSISTSPGNIQVGILFLTRNFLLPKRTRVYLNNNMYDFRGYSSTDSRWDFSVVGKSKAGYARGKVITLNQKLSRVFIPAIDLWYGSGVNDHGFGSSNYKVLTKYSGYNFNNINTGTGGQGWAGASHGGKLLFRHGFNGAYDPNPIFNDFMVPSSYNRTPKFLIVIGTAIGEHPGIPKDFHPLP